MYQGAAACMPTGYSVQWLVYRFSCARLPSNICLSHLLRFGCGHQTSRIAVMSVNVSAAVSFIDKKDGTLRKLSRWLFRSSRGYRADARAHTSYKKKKIFVRFPSPSSSPSLYLRGNHQLIASTAYLQSCVLSGGGKKERKKELQVAFRHVRETTTLYFYDGRWLRRGRALFAAMTTDGDGLDALSTHSASNAQRRWALGTRLPAGQYSTLALLVVVQVVIKR